MRKGQRPCRHNRVIRTKHGKKRILINRHIPKIISRDRRIFNHLSDPKLHKIEYGGGIDFDKKGKLDNINITPGKEMEVELPPDFEVQYHTHPDKYSSPPSPEDVIALLKNKNQQAEMIFRDGKAFQIVKTHSTRALSKLPTNTLMKKFDKAFYSTRKKGEKNFDENWKKYLQKEGFLVDLNKNTNKDLLINIKPVEPRKD
jgi:hypothetical protein